MAARLLESQHFLLCTSRLPLVLGGKKKCEPPNPLKVSHRACGRFCFSKGGLTINSHPTIWPWHSSHQEMGLVSPPPEMASQGATRVIPPGPAFRRQFDLMLCCPWLEILSKFWKRNPAFPLLTGSHKLIIHPVCDPPLSLDGLCDYWLIDCDRSDSK